MQRAHSEEKREEESPLYTINILSAPVAASPASPCNEELEFAVLGWFEGRGIRKVNPEDLLTAHRTTLKVTTRERTRKLSAPDERSMLLHRRAKERISITV